MADLVTLADPTSRVLLPRLPQGHRPALPVLHPRELLPAAPGVRRLLPLGRRAPRLRSAGASAVVARRARRRGLRRPLRDRRQLAWPPPRARHRHRAAAAVRRRGPGAPLRRLPRPQGRPARRRARSPSSAAARARPRSTPTCSPSRRQRGFELTWVTRSPRFFPMEYTKLTLEMTSPEWSSYFQSLPAPRRAEVQAGQAALSKGISSETINAIFDELYRREAHRRRRHHAAHRDRGDRGRTGTASATPSTCATPSRGRHRPDDAPSRSSSPPATRPACPTSSTRSAIGSGGTSRGRFLAGATFAVDHADGEVFVQNAEEHTHGFVAPDLGMGAMRNSVILAQRPRPRAVRRREADRLPGVGHAGPLPQALSTSESRTCLHETRPSNPSTRTRDLALLHAWVTHPRSVFWGMQDATLEQVHDEYARIADDPHHEALLGRADGEPGVPDGALRPRALAPRRAARAAARRRRDARARRPDRHPGATASRPR